MADKKARAEGNRGTDARAQVTRTTESTGMHEHASHTGLTLEPDPDPLP